ncbi:MAG TPA: 50S ribosomal protein L15 [bacterium]|jgi:large subunit ribosomal protein L15|nr:50S ribosomal protein L15 [bacterium]HQC49959.1 50S ribosomal protein L15 [bacterium]
MLSLNTIKKSKGSHKNKKRVGRGNASGRGTYSTRGQKGQRQRAGVSNLKRLGMKSQLLQTPKVRGFKSDKPKNQIVSVKAINNNFKDGDVVNAATLLEKNLISTLDKPVKILGKEKLTVKVKFESIKMSASVKEQAK